MRRPGKVGYACLYVTLEDCRRYPNKADRSRSEATFRDQFNAAKPRLRSVRWLQGARRTSARAQARQAGLRMTLVVMLVDHEARKLSRTSVSVLSSLRKNYILRLLVFRLISFEVLVMDMRT